MDVVERLEGVLVCALDDPRARDPAVVGAKAASLARSRRRHLPVIPGFALTTTVHTRFREAGGRLPDDVAAPVVDAWRRLTSDGRSAAVVRSSSTVEDAATSSMAGRFRSILDVRGPDALLAAVAEVLRSGEEVLGPDPQPMGVLVQRYVEPAVGGVMFGVDPVTGDRRHLVVEAVAGGPDRLVGGQVTAQHYVVSRHGRLVQVDHHPVHVGHALRPHDHRGRLLGVPDLVALARLARRVERVFGAPQDVEWAIERDGTLLLLQSRPVTATAPVAVGHGPVLGPGPLGETFPDPLSELEVDLWLRPLRAGVVDALTEVRVVSSRRLARSPVVTTVDGRVVADLELMGYVPHRSALGPLDPRPAFRQLGAAWRTGTIRATLPQRVAGLVAETDATLEAVDLAELGDRDLLDVAQRGAGQLRRLHRAEVLAGTLLPPSRVTAASVALQVLHELGSPQRPADAVRAHPVLLALAPPSLTATTVPPAPPAPRAASVPPDGTDPLGPREQLRLRIRWVQELTARACRLLEGRLVVEGLLPEPDVLALLRLDEIDHLLATGALPGDLHERRARDLRAALSPPLPAELRLTTDGTVVPVARRGARPGAGVPAGGGRGVGRVAHGSVRRPPSPGDVLVVRELQPGLAAYLPGLAGLVAETGSTLSHLAILAREYDVPTVVAVHDALRRFPPGVRVLVDGSTGEVREAESRAAA